MIVMREKTDLSCLLCFPLNIMSAGKFHPENGLAQASLTILISIATV